VQVRGVQAAVTGGLVRERSQSLCIDCSASKTRLVQGAPAGLCCGVKRKQRLTWGGPALARTCCTTIVLSCSPHLYRTLGGSRHVPPA